MALVVRTPLPLQVMQEIWVQSLGREDTLEECLATHSSILAWEIPWTEEPGGLQSIGSQRVRYNWSNLGQMDHVTPEPLCFPLFFLHVSLLYGILSTERTALFKKEFEHHWPNFFHWIYSEWLYIVFDPSSGLCLASKLTEQSGRGIGTSYTQASDKGDLSSFSPAEKLISWVPGRPSRSRLIVVTGIWHRKGDEKEVPHINWLQSHSPNGSQNILNSDNTVEISLWPLKMLEALK